MDNSFPNKIQINYITKRDDQKKVKSGICKWQDSVM